MAEPRRRRSPKQKHAEGALNLQEAYRRALGRMHDAADNRDCKRAWDEASHAMWLRGQMDYASSHGGAALPSGGSKLSQDATEGALFRCGLRPTRGVYGK